MGKVRKETGIDLTFDELSKPVNQVLQPVEDAVLDIGRDIDKFVRNEIPGGWYTVAALAGGAYYGAEAIAAGNTAEAAALANGATAAEATAAAISAADAAAAAGAFDAAGVGNAMAGYWGAGSAAAPITNAAVADFIGGTGAYDAGVGLDAMTGGQGLASVVGGTAVAPAAPITAAEGLSSLGGAIGDTLLGGVSRNPLQAMQLAGALGAPQQPQQNPYAMGGGGSQGGAVDYSDLLKLLSRKNQLTTGLLGTQFQPQVGSIGQANLNQKLLSLLG